MEGDEVIVSRFINPHLFWLRKCSMAYDKKFIDFEMEMNLAYKKNSQQFRPYKPKLREVSFFYIYSFPYPTQPTQPYWVYPATLSQLDSTILSQPWIESTRPFWTSDSEQKQPDHSESSRPDHPESRGPSHPESSRPNLSESSRPEHPESTRVLRPTWFDLFNFHNSQFF